MSGGDPMWTLDEPLAAEPELSVAEAHRRFCDELDCLLAARCGPGARAVLTAPLGRLAAGLTSDDVAAAGAALDDLEDVLQAVLIAAGWPSEED
ncbi:MAG TPA: hypothetical protein VLM79_31090 [Kofleriaceae bacterium]|nr:hypothetical protein [Kofleriaceae bacterium]